MHVVQPVSVLHHLPQVCLACCDAEGRSGMSTSKSSLATHAAFRRFIAAGMCDNQDVFLVLRAMA